jgi:hypothetical protein
MAWKSIRLELAQSRDFPRGSASRAYLLRLPLGDDGLIDGTSLAERPGQATVRRFWPNQPDLSGTIVPTDRGWAFAYDPGEAEETLVQHEPHPIRLGEAITLTEPDGRRLPFRVASLHGLADRPA